MWAWVQIPLLCFLEDFFSLLEKRGGRTLKFLGCLTPQWQNAWLLKNQAIERVWNNWFLQWNKKFTVRQIFFATWKSAVFLQFLVHFWTKKGSTPNFLELWGFVLMSHMILEEKGTFFSKNVARNRIFPFWGVWPLYSPPGTPRGQGYFFLIDISFLL